MEILSSNNHKKRDSLAAIKDIEDKDSEKILRIIEEETTKNGGFGMVKKQMEDLSENIKVEASKNLQ